VVYAANWAKGIIQSSVKARHAMRPFVKIIWPLVKVVLHFPLHRALHLSTDGSVWHDDDHGVKCFFRFFA